MSPLYRTYQAIAAILTFVSLTSCGSDTISQSGHQPLSIATSLTYISEGYSNSRINVTSFRQHSLYTVGNIQIAAYYDDSGLVTISRRFVDKDIWEVFPTGFTDDRIDDPHDVISFGVDGDKYLHIAWGMHNKPLNYATSDFPVTSTDVSITFSSTTTMVGHETSVTYPQFYECDDGNLLFLFRNGVSGAGDLYLNRYDTNTKTWHPVHGSLNDPKPMISGTAKEPTYSPYAQPMVFDSIGRLHLTWSNRYNASSPLGEFGFQSNHNIYYAISHDNGVTWSRSNGTPYTLPITEFGDMSAGEVAVSIPEGSSLINATSMAVDNDNHPMVASWWAPLQHQDNHTRQYMLAYFDGTTWVQNQITSFSVDYDSDGDTLSDKIPESLLVEYLMARPVVLADSNDRIYVIYTDYRDSNSITMAYTDDRKYWKYLKVNEDNMGVWEPNYDSAQWNKGGEIHMLYQPIMENIPATSVMLLSLKIK